MTRRELHPLFLQGLAAPYEGDLATGRRTLRRMAALSESCGEMYYQAMAQFGLALVEVEFGDVEVAAEAATIGLRAEWQLGARGPTAYLIDSHAWVADRQGDHRRAATLFGAADTIWEAVGSTPDVSVSISHRKHLKSTRSALGEEFAEAFAAGRAMSEEEAVRYGLREVDAESAPPAEPRSLLTKREAEIAALVAEGLTNRDIATKLVIAPRTADTHVQHILTKLDFTNRAQIAAWVADRRPPS